MNTRHLDVGGARPVGVAPAVTGKAPVGRGRRPHFTEQHAGWRHSPSTMSAQPARPKEFYE